MAQLPQLELETEYHRARWDSFRVAYQAFRSLMRRLREQFDLVRRVVNTNEAESASRTRSWMGL